MRAFLLISIFVLVEIAVAKQPMRIRDVKNVICPDGSSQCPTGQTCCKISSGGYGCCPLPNATCCSDETHCCPNGYKCDVSAGTCTKGQEKLSLFTKTDSIKNVVCPGGSSQCPLDRPAVRLAAVVTAVARSPTPLAAATKHTVAPTATNVTSLLEPAPRARRNFLSSPRQIASRTSSAPMALANVHWTDLLDETHCCPNGYKCDVSAGTCTKGQEKLSLFTKTDSIKNVVCPDGSSQCPTGQTCSTKHNCCPNGYKCDVSAGTCTKGQEKLSLFTKTDSIKNVVCPDGSSQCPTGQTCSNVQLDRPAVRLAAVGYGCCPLPNATCCSDETHCCPNGYKCDVSAGTCTKGQEKLSLFTKTAALKSVKNVVCPDGSSQCPTGQTCCKISSGGYGCCPLPNATCCSDETHCCPNGYKCDVSAGTCTKGQEKLSLFTKTAALKSVKNVVCPDGSSQCPTGQTCCKISSGGYGCCPLPNATCCSDETHCCPNGYKCDVSAGTCTKGQEKLSLFTKTAALKSVKNVVCPDGSSQCPTGQTCCKISSGGYGCCPLPNATCCSDETHCCPNGYKCDVSAGTCTKGLEAIPFIKKHHAKKMKNDDTA
eukprot:Em0964g3a